MESQNWTSFRSGTRPDEEFALRCNLVTPEKQHSSLSRWLLYAGYFTLFPMTVHLLARMRLPGSRCCNEGKLQLVLAQLCSIRKHSDKANVFAIQREGN